MRRSQKESGAWPDHGLIHRLLPAALFLSAFIVPAGARALVNRMPVHYAPAVLSYRPAEIPSFWVRPLTLAVAAAIMCIIAFLLRRRTELLRSFVPVGVISLLTRALVPFGLLHTQTDDLRLVSTVRGIPGFDLSGFNSEAGLVVPLFRFFMGIAGDNLISMQAASLLAGVLMPPLVLLIGAYWFRDVRYGRWAAIPLIISPAAWAFSGAISAYMVAATIFAASLAAGVIARDCRFPARLALLILSTLLLFTASLLKPEFLLLIPVYGLLIHAAWDGTGRLPRMLVLLAPAVVLVVIAVFFLPYIKDFLYASAGRRNGIDGVLAERLITYFVVGFLLLNPPFLPYKAIFIKGLIRPAAKGVRALQIAAMSLASIYVLSVSSFGMNQWRHALIFLVPFHLAVAPEICQAVNARRNPRVKLLLAAILVFDLAGFAFYAHNVKTNSDIVTPFLESHVDAESLVLYAPQQFDMNPANLFASLGVPRSLPLDELWPATCVEWRRQKLVGLRTRAVDILNSAGLQGWNRCSSSLSKAFLSIDTLGEDLQKLKSCLGPSADTRLDGIARELADADANLAPEQCIEDLDSTRELLRPFKRVLLYIDYGVVLDKSVFNYGSKHCREYFDLAIKNMDAEVPAAIDKPEFVEVGTIRSTDGDVLWERP